MQTVSQLHWMAVKAGLVMRLWTEIRMDRRPRDVSSYGPPPRSISKRVNE